MAVAGTAFNVHHSSAGYRVEKNIDRFAVSNKEVWVLAVMDAAPFEA